MSFIADMTEAAIAVALALAALVLVFSALMRFAEWADKNPVAGWAISITVTSLVAGAFYAYSK